MQVSGSGGEAVDPAFYRAASAKQGGGQQTDAAARVSSANAANAGASGADAPASSETGVKVRLGEPARRTDDSPLYGASGRLASETLAASTQDANAQVGGPTQAARQAMRQVMKPATKPQRTRKAATHRPPARRPTTTSRRASPPMRPPIHRRASRPDRHRRSSRSPTARWGSKAPSSNPSRRTATTARAGGWLRPSPSAGSFRFLSERVRARISRR